ncbi:hypothetical protein L6E12_05265 [Actinokineospora sp. PR83]|nr:hypothetical protein [Actinokineospora sp. PR83]
MIGRSQEWLRQIEKGIRPLDSLQTLGRIAEALRVENWSDLVDLPTGLDLDARPAGRPDFVHLLWRSLLGVREGGPRTPGPPRVGVAVLDRRVTGVWSRWHAPGRNLGAIAHDVASLLNGTRDAMTWCAGRQPRELPGARRAHGQALQLARVVLSRTNEHWLSHVAAAQCLALTVPAEDAVLTGVGEHGAARSLLGLGFAADAERLALASLEALACAPVPARQRYAVEGALHLLAAEAAAQANDVHTCQEMLRRAEKMAERQVLTSHPVFGPVSTQISEVRSMLRLGHVDLAVDLAERIGVDDQHPADEQADLHLAVAHARACRQDHVPALLMLLKLERTAEDVLRYSPLAAETIRQLLETAPYSLHAELRRLGNLAYDDC